MEEVEKLHGLHNTGMTMHERFTLLTEQSVGRRLRPRGPARTNPALIEAIIHQLNQRQKPTPRFRGGGRGGLRRSGSEGSLHSMAGLRRARSRSIGYYDMPNKDQHWRGSNGNLSYAGSINGSVYSVSSGRSVTRRGYWLRGDAVQRLSRGRGGARGRGRGRGGRVNRGRVSHVNQPVGFGRPARGAGRRGVRRNVAQNRRGQRDRGRGRARGGISHNQVPKPVPSKEALDAELDQYMSCTKAALDRQLDEYMRNAMELE